MIGLKLFIVIGGMVFGVAFLVVMIAALVLFSNPVFEDELTYDQRKDLVEKEQVK